MVFALNVQKNLMIFNNKINTRKIIEELMVESKEKIKVIFIGGMK